MAGFKKARGEQAALKIGMYGAAGHGKTLTALLIAEGLARITGKRIAFVDTERGTDFYTQHIPARTVHPEAFDFDALYTRSITEINQAIGSLKDTEYGVVVIDSVTHIWEACQNAYTGKRAPGGQIPMHAWGKIKAPYKHLMQMLLNSKMHVLLLGRQGMEYAENEDGETKAVGTKMKAEGETAYEPHILIRMEAVRVEKKKHQQAIITAFVEKDRTGVLGGKLIEWPNFDNIAKPLLGLLGDTQAKIQSDDETSMQDAEAIAKADREKAAASQILLEQFQAKLALATSLSDAEALGKSITADMKKKMLPDHVNRLRQTYLDTLAKHRGMLRPSNGTAEHAPDRGDAYEGS